MKTIELKLFEYSELSEQAKEKARDWFNRDGANVDYIYSDAHETVKAFFKHFPGSEGRNSWLDINTNNIDDNILELTGHRLATYIFNNYGNVLFKRKYLGCIGDNRVIKHRMSKTNYYDMKKGALVNSNNFIYSNIQKSNCYVLTDVCYDDDLLDPIYKFLKAPSKSINFEELLNDCFHSLRKSIENEVEYRNSREAIEEDIEANEYTFLEDGTRFNG